MWTLVLIGAAVAIVIVVSVVRSRFAARNRSAKWDDLRERGKMFTSQLAKLRENSTHVEPLSPAEVKLRTVQPSRFGSFWPRRPGESAPNADSALVDRSKPS